MEQRINFMKNDKPDEICAKLDQTRMSLRRKISSLELGVHRGLSEVKGSVESSYKDIKQIFDLKYQVRSHPWPAFGLAVGLGILARQGLRQSTPGHYDGPEFLTESERSGRHIDTFEANGQRKKDHGIFNQMADQFERELNQLKELL